MIPSTLDIDGLCRLVSVAERPGVVIAALLKADLAALRTPEAVARLVTARPSFDEDFCAAVRKWVPDAAGAAAAVRAALEPLGNWNSNARALRAQIAFDAKQWPEAEAALRLLAERGVGDFHQVRQQWAHSLLEAGRPAEAFAALGESLAELPPYKWLDSGARLLKRILKVHTPAGKRTARIAILGSSTTKLLVPFIELLCYRDGITPTIYEGGYGQYQQEIIDPQSGLARFAPEIVILAVSHRDAELDELVKADGAAAQEEAIVERFQALWARCASQLRCHVIQSNFDLPAVNPHGHLSQKLAGGRNRRLRRLNMLLAERTPDGVSILDVDQISAQFGKQAWSDPTMWAMAKQHPGVDALPLLAENIVAQIRAVLGLTRKCLVLDLDNTLWGGVIGEDGLAQIRIGQGDPIGEAFLAFQQYCSELRRRGVVLAVCSKNNPEDAALPFEKHSDMVLRRGDFAAFAANWEPKAANLRAIAAALNLGLDSFVFVDDNPIERAAVRRELPEVAVPELPEDPARRLAQLDRHLYFEAISVSAEDLMRANSYAQRAELAAQAGDAASMAEFLAGLEMVADMGSFDDENLPRVVQLINKTNQFNLTTRRYTVEQVRAMTQSPSHVTLWSRLKDRTGDHGLVSVLIGKADGDALEIDTWLMSCRVMGRGLEEAAFGEMARMARERGLSALRGLYIPTAKNPMVKDLYPRLGFASLGDGQGDDGAARWEYDLRQNDVPPARYIKIVFRGANEPPR